MTWQEVAGYFTAGSGGVLLSQLVPWLWRTITNREKQRRSDADKAWAQRDEQARRRRIMEEHAHVLRRVLIEAPCVARADIPPWPTSRGTTPDPSREDEES